MKKLVPVSLALSLVACGWMVACGDSADDATGDGLGNGTGSKSGSGSTGNGSQSGTGGFNLGNGGDGLGGDGTGPIGSWDGQACADGSSGGNLEPIYLVFLLDQSGSMGDCFNFDNLDRRWQPVVSAMSAFFADEESEGLYASLSMFPTDVVAGTACVTGDENLECDAGSYDTPVVEPTELPNDTVFADAMDVYPNEYGTPTYPALAGTVIYAKSLEAEGKKVAIVMVTDGEPQFCGSDNTVANAASEAADALAEGIPTYVIGVGNSLEDLNTIASDGGTEEAFIIDPAEPGSSPEATQQALLAKINEIRGAQVSCVMTIPDPPAGKTLDPKKVNVEYTTGGDTTLILMNDDCGGDEKGWRYDDETNPTKIELCSATCKEVKAQPDAALNVVFGCEVRTDPIK